MRRLIKRGQTSLASFFDVDSIAPSKKYVCEEGSRPRISLGEIVSVASSSGGRLRAIIRDPDR
jgi:hypothetical protein